MTTDTDTDLIAEAITAHYGPRCGTKDTDDFPELLGGKRGRCRCCLAWDQYDALTTPPADEALDGITTALRSGQQADMDGCMVKVSRQACEEGADALTALRSQNAAKDARIAELGRKFSRARTERRHAEVERDQLRAENERLRARTVLPRLTREMIEAACVAHYGKEPVALVGGADGVDMTSRDVNYAFPVAFRRMWSGVRAALQRKAGE